MPIRILLVEDEPLWQAGIAALISTDSNLELVSTVDNADDAEVFFDAEKPDVVLLDWKIRGPRDGMELGRSLSQRLDPKRMILVTGSPSEQIPAHPFGYVPKPRIASDLVDAIHHAVS